MRRSVTQAACCICVLATVVACRRPGPRGDTERPSPPQVSGALAIGGLSAPVRIVRDKWGIPHVYAETRDDLFFAQGFVQAQDRLFQMDLWRRAVQGRLSEGLDPDLLARDLVTRRDQYRGAGTYDGASYRRGQ